MKKSYVHNQSAQLQCTVHSNLTQNSKPRESYKRWKDLLNGNTLETPQLTILRLPELGFFFYLKHQNYQNNQNSHKSKDSSFQC